VSEENLAAAPPPKGGSMKTTLIVVVVVALLEGGAFFGAMKFFGGGPAPTYGADGNHAVEGPPPPPEKGSAELMLLKNFRVPNIKSGRTVFYDFDISVAVPEDRKAEVEELAKSRDAEIRDRVSQIIRQARPAVLEEDDFATLRMLLSRALGEVLGDTELIQRVLIPRCLPLPGD
jgi:flagellar basal body-associated protein FliL